MFRCLAMAVWLCTQGLKKNSSSSSSPSTLLHHRALLQRATMVYLDLAEPELDRCDASQRSLALGRLEGYLLPPGRRLVPQDHVMGVGHTPHKGLAKALGVDGREAAVVHSHPHLHTDQFQ